MGNGTDFFKEHPMFLLDQQTLEIQDVNKRAVEFYGYSKEEFLEMNVDDLRANSEVGERVKNTTSGDQKNLYEDERVWTHKKKDGAPVQIQFTSHLFHHDGKPVKLLVAHDVSGLVKQQNTGSAKFPRIESYLSNSPLAEIEWDKDYTIKTWSETAEEIFGWSAEEVRGDETFFENFIHPDEQKEAYKNLNQAVENKQSNYTVEGRNFTKEGKVQYCRWYNSILYDEKGELVSIYSLVHDISERRQSENLFRALSEKSLVGVYLIQDNVFKYVNPKFARIFHYPVEEIVDEMGPLDLTHPDDRDLVEENLRKRLTGKAESLEYDFRCLTKDDQVIHVNVYGTRINYMGKKAVIGTLVDITDRKLSMEQYRASVESFEDLFDSISDGIYILNQNGRFIEVNRGAVEMYGYEREKFIGKQLDFLAAPGKVDMDRTYSKIRNALDGEKQMLDWWGKRKNGEVFPKEVVLNPGTYFGEDVVIAIGRDTTDRFEAEEQLKKNEEMFRQLFQNAPIGIAMMDHHHEIRLVNTAFEEIFGYEPEEIEGLDIDRVIVPGELRNEARDLSADVFAGNVTALTSRRKRKDGSLVDVIIYGVPVIINGKTIAIFGIYVDITERKRAEQRIRQSLKEKEVLLAEIHHRVKNNLAVITGLLELQAYNTSSAEATEIIKESQLRINSIALIHEKLYQSENLSQISFDIYMQELVDIIVNALIKDERDISLHIDAESVNFTINQAIPCGLILNELITNCYKHAFNGIDNGRIDIRLNRDQDNILLQIEDNGTGLPEGLDFENPNTLGLTLIRTLSKQLHGNYEFKNKEKGMRFELNFQFDG